MASAAVAHHRPHCSSSFPRGIPSKSPPPRRKSSRKPRNTSDEFACSELWAGPAYSCSPPPSSLPIPTFSLRQRRSASLDLPSSSSPPPAAGVRPGARSAPASPRSEGSVSATESLKRILNLDASD